VSPLVDALGRRVAAPPHPARIVSLVPSLTELLFALGVGDRVAAVTDYCLHPADALRALPRVGGQKDPDLERLLALAPDLVLAAKEENLRRDVERLDAAGVPVYVTDVRTVEAALALPSEIGAATLAPAARIDELGARMAAGIAAARACQTGRRRLRVFAAVWRDPWMGAGLDTYASALLEACGAENVLGEARRYPKLTLDQLARLAPDLILLPSEPYPFGPADLPPARAVAPALLVDGTLLFWYGPRTARAGELAERLHACGAGARGVTR